MMLQTKKLTLRQRERSLVRQTIANRLFIAAALFALFIALATLVILVVNILIDGLPRLSLDFLTAYPSRKAERAGILAPLVGTIYMIGLTALFAFPLGVAAAIHLEEFAEKNRFSKIVEIAIANLAGIPSIVYGLLGLGLFVRLLHLERSLLSGALTMSLLILPIIIMTAREALRTVPNTIREGSYALGASRWQTVRYQVFPLALPGILTGTILALSRAIGETAPLIMIGALTYIPFLPDGLFSPFTVLPIQIFNWVSRPQQAFAINAAAGIIVLLVILISMNAIAIWLRNKYQKMQNW
ncbi:MAG: phosphate ABC transporter permease PstA [Nitrospirota bacterium]